jgi:uncharacterized LabA/DUF88 family protein
MARVAIFIDAGYLFAQGSTLLTGKKTQRGEVRVDFDKCIDALEKFACNLTNIPLLRIYWYDGTSTGPSTEHVALAFKPRVKVRLGFVNSAGQQKGVDSLIVTDMINLARNRSMCDAVLLSGDEDIRVGVQQAQEFGVRVHLLGITPCRGTQSQFLLQEADTTYEWTLTDISAFMTHTPRPARIATALPVVPQVATPASPPAPKTLKDLATQAAAEIDAALLDGLIKNFDATGQLPPDVDRPLLGRARQTFGRMGQDQLRDLRKAFIEAMKHRLSAKPAAQKPIT